MSNKKYRLADYNMDQIREKMRDQEVTDFEVGQLVAYIPTHINSPVSDSIEYGRVKLINPESGHMHVTYFKDVLMVGSEALGKSTRPYDLLQLDI